MRSRLLWRCRWVSRGLVELWGLCTIRHSSERALRTRGLLCLNRAKVIAASMATMVDKVAMAERLLEVLTRFGLETPASVGLLALASAGA